MDKENRSTKISKSLIIKIAVLLTLIFVFIIFKILANNEYFCDSFSKTFVRLYCIIFGSISSFFPISIFELFLISTIVYSILWIIFFIRNTIKTGIKKSYQKILRLLIIVMSIITVYQCTAGVEYGRSFPDIPQHNNLIEDKEEYKNICFDFIDDFNACAEQLDFAENGSLIKPYTDDILIAKLQAEYKRLNSDYFHNFTVRAKPLYQTSWAYLMLSISGVTFIPTGEANYNVLCNDSHLPFTIAHEMAHAKGAMPEEYANIVAAYICLNSSDPYIRYSGYNNTISSLLPFIRATNNKEYEEEFSKRIDENIYRDMIFQRDYWTKYAVLEKISNWINDLYLKSNNDNGVVSYQDNIDVDVTPVEYKINSYSRYQALYLWLYYDR